MPMQRELYPPNWEEIAWNTKKAANWRCEQCERPCRKAGVDWADFELWLYENHNSPHAPWWDDLFGPDEVEPGVEARHYQRFTLTVAHLDQNPGNNDPSNLAALCAPCHLRHDAPPSPSKQQA